MSRRSLRAIGPLGVVLSLWVTLAGALGQSPEPGVFPVPDGETPVRFAVLGDTGTGDRPQDQIGSQAAAARQRFPFDFAILLGDNMYGGERPQDYRKKFEQPYRPLLDAGVEFYAALGNHDDPDQRFYKPFHMNGERYYRFKKGDVAFFVLDSNYMDPQQLSWLEKELAASGEKWKIAYSTTPRIPPAGRTGPRRTCARSSSRSSSRTASRSSSQATSISTSASSLRKGSRISSRAARRN